MKKRMLSILLPGILFFGKQLAAQHMEPSLAGVIYEFVHVNDLEHRENPRKTKMIMLLGQVNSRYYTLRQQGEINRNNRQNSYVNSYPPGTVLQGRLSLTVKSQGNPVESYYQVPSENKLVMRANLGTIEYEVDTELPKIDWKIENDTMRINKYTCQKAVGVLGGRTYTAWFTAELPFRYGPWKLCGLPGLILEAYDGKKEVCFYFREIYKESGNGMITVSNTRTVKVSEKAYARLKKAFDDDPVSVTETQSPVSAASMIVYYQDAAGNLVSGDEAKAYIKKESKKQTNNPLELTKQ